MIVLLLAATLIGPPEPRIDWRLLAADAAVRSFDVYTTQGMLKRGGHEYFLPNSIVEHPAAMEAYGLGCVGLDYLGAKILIKHGHPRVAEWLVITDASQDGYWAVQNLFIKRKK